MSMKNIFTVENFGRIELLDKNFLASGGEAQIYVKDKTAYKIYHDSNKMIPLTKIQELGHLTSTNVLKPKNIIRDKDNVAVGYTMPFIKSTHPLCKLFTLAFKQTNRISNDNIVSIVKEIQTTIDQVHKDGCLIVDLNELNLLISKRFDIPYFIDVDSYQTKSHKATAIMDSIRDRLIKHNQFTENSDWFSFAIIAFQLYVGIHPYKGTHPKYKSSEWSKRMDDGVSVFDKNVSIPRICNPFTVIPKRHRDWFESVFMRNERGQPPMPDGVVVSIPTLEFFVESTAEFETNSIIELTEKILNIFNFMGVDYIVGEKHLYKANALLPHDIKGYKTLLCESSDMSPVICKLKDELLTFEDMSSKKVGSINASQIMYRNGAIYSVYDGKLMENTFAKFSNKLIHKTRLAANVLDLSTKVFDGVVFQDVLGKCYITLPYEKGKCFISPVTELNGYRLLEAKSEKNVCVVIAEKKGVYYRFVMFFDKEFKQYSISKTDNINYDMVNFTVLPSGVCVMAVDTDVHIFVNNQVKIVNNPPFNASTKLYTSSGGVFFINNNKVYSIKMKK